MLELTAVALARHTLACCYGGGFFFLALRLSLEGLGNPRGRGTRGRGTPQGRGHVTQKSASDLYVGVRVPRALPERRDVFRRGCECIEVAR